MNATEAGSDDTTLAIRAVAGDREAFASLYDRYFDPIYDFVARMVRDRSEAEDVVQDTFIKAMRALPGLREPERFRGWLFSIARSSALTRIEQARRTLPLGHWESGDGPGEMTLIDEDRLADPEMAVSTREHASLVWEAAGSLNSKQLSWLDMHVRQGLDTAEIAGAMGVSVNHASVTLGRLRQAMDGAIGALLLARTERGECPILKAIIDEFGPSDFSSVLRKRVERHLQVCERCLQRRRRLVAPLATFGALAPVSAPPGFKSRLRETLIQNWPASAPASSPEPLPAAGLRPSALLKIVSSVGLFVAGIWLLSAAIVETHPASPCQGDLPALVTLRASCLDGMSLPLIGFLGLLVSGFASRPRNSPLPWAALALLSVALTALAVISFTSPTTLGAAPLFDLSPQTGPPGAAVEVTGFQSNPGNPPHRVLFDGTPVAQFSPTPNGTFVTQLTVPLLPPGVYVVQVCDGYGGQFEDCASANFLVTQLPTPTPAPAIATPTLTPSPTATATQPPTATATPTPVPPTATPAPTATPSPTATATPVASSLTAVPPTPTPSETASPPLALPTEDAMLEPGSEAVTPGPSDEVVAPKGEPGVERSILPPTAQIAFTSPLPDESIVDGYAISGAFWVDPGHAWLMVINRGPEELRLVVPLMSAERRSEASSGSLRILLLSNEGQSPGSASPEHFTFQLVDGDVKAGGGHYTARLCLIDESSCPASAAVLYRVGHLTDAAAGLLCRLLATLGGIALVSSAFALGRSGLRAL